MIRCNAAGRYDLHELLRQYVAAKLTEQEQKQLAHHHFDYFLGLAAQGDQHLLYGGPGKLGWVERLDTEIDNLRAALTWSLTSDNSALRVHLSALLGHFWMCAGRWREGYIWSERCLAGSSTAPLAVQAAALTGFGRLILSFPGDIRRAEEVCLEALRLARESDDEIVLERALGNAGYFGDPRNALPLLEEAVRLSRAWGNKGALLNALHVQALRTMDTGDYERALALQEEGLALAREIQEPTLTGWSLYCMAEITLLQGNLSRTMDLCQECLGLFRDVHDRNGEAITLMTLGKVAYREQHNKQAQHYWLQALTIWQEVGSRSNVAWMLRLLGRLALTCHNPVRAATLFGAAGDYVAIWGVSVEEAVRECAEDAAAARAALGEIEFDRAYAHGCRMSLEQAVAYALDVLADDISD